MTCKIDALTIAVCEKKYLFQTIMFKGCIYLHVHLDTDSQSHVF